jgi:AcrR family transcriptional regulator
MNATATAPVRQRIVDAADRLFYGQGIHAVGVDLVAAEAGVSKRTLYKHFPSKDELVAAYLARRASTPPPDGPEPPAEKLLATFDRLAAWFAHPRFRGCPFVNAVSELGGDAAHPAVSVCRALKRQRLAWYQAQAEALGVADPALLAQQFVVLVEGAVAASLVRGGDAQAAQAAKAAAAVLLQAAGVELPQARSTHAA